MKTQDSQIRYANHPTPLLLAAGLSLFAGTLAYLLARPVAPAFITEALTNSPIGALQGSLFLPFAQQLPSFFHMLAMLLATLAVTTNQPGIRAGALAVSVALGVAMEFVQHPAVLNSVSACTKTAFCGWLPGLDSYARGGTFDPLDLVAIACAVLITLLCIQTTNLIIIDNSFNKDLTQ